ncbi:MAG: DEAD/DEAH box helicase [Candidatus Paceibacterota bacterium]|jgi:SNF2 family DNA or RNA helicase
MWDIRRKGNIIVTKTSVSKSDALAIDKAVRVRTYLLEIGFIYDETRRGLVTFYSESVIPRILESEFNNEFIIHSSLVSLAGKKWSDIEPLELPTKREQFAHQKVGNRLLLENHKFMLAWEMGTGKSNVVIVTADDCFRNGLADKCLIVTDSSLVNTWVKKLIPPDSDHLSTSLIGTSAERKMNLNISSRDGRTKYFVINYDGLRVLQKELMEFINEKTIIVLDESQRLKSHTTARCRSMKKIVSNCNPKYIWALTGTPITQRPEDIFGQALVLKPDAYGSSWTSFQSLYVIHSSYNQHVVTGYKNMPKFVDIFRSFSHRLTKEEVCSELPERTYLEVEFDLAPELRSIYNDFVKNKVLRKTPTSDILLAVDHPLTLLGKSRQIVSDWYYETVKDEEEDTSVTYARRLLKLKANPKLEFIKQILDDTGEPIIIWFAHRADRLIIEDFLATNNIKYSLVDGSIPVAERQEKVDLFEEGKVQVFLGQPFACSTGFTIVRASYIFYYNNVYSVERREQSEARSHRIGLKHPVTYYDLVYSKTVEEGILKGLKAKIELKDLILNGKNDVGNILEGEIYL